MDFYNLIRKVKTEEDKENLFDKVNKTAEVKGWYRILQTARQVHFTAWRGKPMTKLQSDTLYAIEHTAGKNLKFSSYI